MKKVLSPYLKAMSPEARKSFLAGKEKATETQRLNREKKDKLARKEYKKNPTRCKCCDAKFPFEKRHNKFCDSSCSATFNTTGRIRSKKKPGKCKYCKKELSNCVKHFCDSDCFQAYRKKQADDKIKKKGHNHNVSASALKRAVLEKQGGKQCCECGRKTWNGKPIPLEKHHINGIHTDERLKNICYICPNCHAQTDNYKAKNMGHGRQFRRQRYPEGKSF